MYFNQYATYLDKLETHLTKSNLKLKPNEANTPGLQLSDLLAYPSKQGILVENMMIPDPGDVFGKQITDAIANKYIHAAYDGLGDDYGKILLK